MALDCGEPLSASAIGHKGIDEVRRNHQRDIDDAEIRVNEAAPQLLAYHKDEYQQRGLPVHPRSSRCCRRATLVAGRT
jgi:hypothetical protein